MFFLAFCILQLMFNLSSAGSLGKSVYNEFKLVKKINTFYQQNNPKGTISENIKQFFSNISLYAEGKMTEPVVEAFENNLKLLLQQLNNYYYEKLPKFENVQEMHSKNVDTIYEIHDQSPHEQTVCKYMPRCLNFIYTTNGKRPSLLLLYTFYSILCNTIPKFLAQNCDGKNNNPKIYNCRNSTIYLLYSNIESLDLIKNVNTNKKYQEKGEKFILKMFELITNIDILTMINKNIGIHENLFNDIAIGYRKYPISPPYYHVYKLYINNENFKYLNQKMKEINRNYYNKMVKQCDPSIGISNDDVSSLKAYYTTTNLLLYTFTRLEKHFKFNVFTPNNPMLPKNNSHLINKNDINILMSEMFDKLCNYMPIILFHTNNNDRIDRKLFSMYFTFCGDYTNLFSECPDLDINNFNVIYNKKCIINVIQEKIQINFVSLTETVSIHDKYVNNSECTNANYDYIKEIYEIIRKSYEGTFIPLWTTHEWLSGKYFLMNEKNYRSTDMKKLQQQTILIDNVPLKLQEISSTLLPWNSNTNVIFTFLGIIYYKINEIFSKYVYRLAQIIILNVQCMNNTVKDEALEGLKRSINWYTYASDIIYKYLFFRADLFLNDDIRNITFEIQSFNNDRSVRKIKKVISKVKSMESELKEWSDAELQNSKEINTIVKLNKIMENNCKNAMDFLNDLISILIQSNLMNKENQTNILKLYETYC